MSQLHVLSNHVPSDHVPFVPVPCSPRLLLRFAGWLSHPRPSTLIRRCDSIPPGLVANPIRIRHLPSLTGCTPDEERKGLDWAFRV
jgi:hypothetical protein